MCKTKDAIEKMESNMSQESIVRAHKKAEHSIETINRGFRGSAPRRRGRTQRSAAEGKSFPSCNRGGT